MSKLPQLSFCQKLFFANQTPAPSKALVGVDRPMKVPSMHIQKPYEGKNV